LIKRLRLAIRRLIERYEHQSARKRLREIWQRLPKIPSRKKLHWGKRKLLHDARHVTLGETGIVAGLVLVLFAIAFYNRADIFCSRRNSEGPKMAGIILMWGCPASSSR
jgi:ferric-dicitrate binding protein FerR (iron transport regulator)